MPGPRGQAGGVRRGSSRLGQCLHPLSTQEGLGPGGRWGSRAGGGFPCADLAGSVEKEVAESVWAVFRSGPSGPSPVGGGWLVLPGYW